MAANGKVDRSKLEQIGQQLMTGPIERLSLTVVAEDNIEEFLHGQQAHELLESGVDWLGVLRLWNRWFGSAFVVARLSSSAGCIVKS